MKRKRKLNTTNEKVETRYANWMAQLISIMQPWSLYWIAGRASAKTVQVLAERVQEAAHDCPGAPFAWVADTYSDLHKNVIPSLIDGLTMLGWINGVHYVINREPPKEWKRRMYNVATEWKNTMVFYTGFNFTFVSLDRTAIGAGRSYVGVFGDEVKYFPEEKFNNLLKAVRGFRVKYGNNVWYRSRTLTTDMPDPNRLGEYDWIMKLAKQNDKRKILLALKAGFVYNDTKMDYIARLQRYEALKEKARLNADLRQQASEAEHLMRLAERTMERWRTRWETARRGLSFFFISSSYVNADILGQDWFRNEFAEGLEGTQVNVLSVIPRLQPTQLFYCNLSMRNFYADGFLNEVIDRHEFGWEQDCTVLRYLDPGRPIEAGMDAGNMLSMVFGQQTGHALRVMKEIYTLPPQNVRDLADKFLLYFKPHRRKTLKLYYDRSMNSYRRTGADMATQVKKAIERDADGKPTGWHVQLMSLGQGNIGSNLEYRFFQELLPGHLQGRLFGLMIDQHNCPNLKSEMEVTRTKAREDPRGGSTLIVKEKTGDKLPVHRLARESTNLTDALKYFVLRPDVIRAWQAKGGVSGAAYT